MDLIAYALRHEYAGTVTQKESDDDPGTEVPAFTGGLIRAGELEIDVAEELEAGDGFIVLDERAGAAAAHLDEYPPLKRVPVPAGVNAPTGSFAEAPPYTTQTVTELKADATSRGLEGAGSARKPELVVALEEHDRRRAEGGLDELGAPLTIDALVAAATGTDQADAEVTAEDNDDQAGAAGGGEG